MCFCIQTFVFTSLSPSLSRRIPLPLIPLISAQSSFLSLCLRLCLSACLSLSLSLPLSLSQSIFLSPYSFPSPSLDLYISPYSLPSPSLDLYLSLLTLSPLLLSISISLLTLSPLPLPLSISLSLLFPLSLSRSLPLSSLHPLLHSLSLLILALISSYIYFPISPRLGVNIKDIGYLLYPPPFPISLRSCDFRIPGGLLSLKADASCSLFTPQVPCLSGGLCRDVSGVSSFNTGDLNIN